jgi:hypothetical protein
MPPRLNMPCMPLISGVPPCSSSCAASVLIDTSNTLVTRPKAASRPSRADIAGHGDQAGQQQCIDAAAHAGHAARAVAADPAACAGQADHGAGAGREHGQPELGFVDAVVRLDGGNVHAPRREDEAGGKELGARRPARACGNGRHLQRPIANTAGRRSSVAACGLARQAFTVSLRTWALESVSPRATARRVLCCKVCTSACRSAVLR